MKDNGQNHSGYSDNNTLLAPAFGYPLVFELIVRRDFGFYSSVGNFDQSRLEVNTSMGNPHRLFLSGRLVVAWRAQRQRRLEESNCDISVPISERTVMVESRLIPGIVERRLMAGSNGLESSSIAASGLWMSAHQVVVMLFPPSRFRYYTPKADKLSCGSSAQ